MIDAVPSLGQPLAIMGLAAPGGRGPCPISYALSPATLETASNAWSMAWRGGPCPISYALSPATLETASNAWSMAWRAVTELAEGVVVVIDRARPGWRLSPGWRLFFLAPSFLGKLFRAAADRRRGPPGSLKNRKARTSPHRPKVYTKGSAVRIRAIAGLVIGTAWRLVLVASPGPLFPRRVGGVYTAGQRCIEAPTNSGRQ
jgi:hypothetical protein